MPAIAPPPTPGVAFVWEFPSAFWASCSLAQGAEGKRIYEAAEEARLHYSERAEMLVGEIAEECDLSLAAVPPNRVFYVKTRYIRAGKGKPQYFDLSDD